MSEAQGQELPRAKSLAPVLALALIGVLVLSGVLLDQFYFKNQPRKRLAPDVTFYDRNGGEVTLESFRGKVVLLNFWATWCAPCIDEAPSLDRLAATLQRDLPDVVVLAPALDDEGFKAVDPFLQKLRLESLQVVHDKKRGAHEFGTKKLPETWLIARDGEILERFVGARDWTNPDIYKLLEKAAKDGPEAFRQSRDESLKKKAGTRSTSEPKASEERVTTRGRTAERRRT